MAHRTPFPVKVLVALLTPVAVLAGVWFTGGVLAPGFAESVIFNTAFFAIATVVVVLVVRARRDLLVPLGLTFAVVTVAIGGFAGYNQLHDDVVDEDVVMADVVPVPATPAAPGEPAPPRNVLLAKGSFGAIEKDAEGTAKVIDVADGRKGRKLTLTGFRVTRGPDYYVYLAKGPATVSDVPDYESLGRLKGNVGD